MAAAMLLVACGGGSPDTANNEAQVAQGGAGSAAAGSETATPGSTDNAAAREDPQAEGSAFAAAEFAGVDQPAAEDPPGAEREQAQALTMDSVDATFAKPKIAAVDYENNVTTERRDLLARFKLVILGARTGDRLGNFAGNIKSRSASTKVASYTAFNETPCSAASDNYYYPMVQAANANDYWLHYANGGRTQWTTAYGACDLNLSQWGRKDSSGQTWVQRKAQFDYDNVFKYSSIDYVFADNMFWRPRVDADWRRNGTNQSRNDATIQAAQRAGQAAYWSAIKGKRSNLKIVGNSDGDLSQSEYMDKLEGAMMEGAMGRSWSIETWAGWGPMMAHYRALLRNTVAPNDVLFQVYSSTTDYRLMRYGLASALLENGWFVHLPNSGTLRATWFDEFEAPLGRPTEAPPTGPKSNGIWARKYENGIVLVNPQSGSASIYVGGGYHRLQGTQDPAVNNGKWETTVTLPAKSGLIMSR